MENDEFMIRGVRLEFRNVFLIYFINFYRGYILGNYDFRKRLYLRKIWISLNFYNYIDNYEENLDLVRKNVVL